MKDGFIIGRGEKADITILDDKISSKHLHITVNENNVFIKDLDTSNGTVKNGVELKSMSKYEVQEDDKVVIGRITLVFSDQKELKSDTNSHKQANLREIQSFEGEGISIEFEGGHEYAYNPGEIDGPRKQIRTNNFKIKKIHREIEKIDAKAEQKQEFSKRLEQLEAEKVELLKEGPELKEKYEKHYEEWKDISLKIKKAERELNKLKESREIISPVMEKYEEFQAVSEEKNDLISEIKRLGRENLGNKKRDCFSRIKELEQGIIACEQQINDIAQEKERHKEREKQRIRDQIAQLQAKLDETG